MHEHQLRIDEDRSAALDILLLLADGEARSDQPKRALGLLNDAEDAGCVLPREYEIKRLLWGAALAAG